MSSLIKRRGPYFFFSQIPLTMPEQQQLCQILVQVVLGCYFDSGLDLFAGCVRNRQNSSKEVK